MANKYRTHKCIELTEKLVDKKVRVAGFVENIRDHGGVIFLDLRDMTGVIQVVSNDDSIFDGITRESSITIEGTIRKRNEEDYNSRISTGTIELLVESLEVLGKASNVLPFEVMTSKEVAEDVRLKYRYLDMRNPKVRENIIFRTKVIDYLRKNKIGALMVIERDVSLQDYITPATKVYADLTSPLLGTIFFPNSPLHDGGVIIQGDRITCAGAVFKTSMDPNLNKKLGTRHRAALGIAEESDAIALIVSEETGRISIAVDHEIHYNLTLDEFRMKLVEELKPKAELFYDADGNLFAQSTVSDGIATATYQFDETYTPAQYSTFKAIISKENFNDCADAINNYLLNHNNKLLFEVREHKDNRYIVSVISAYYKQWTNTINKAIQHEQGINVHIDSLAKGGYLCHTDITPICQLTGKNYTHSVTSVDILAFKSFVNPESAMPIIPTGFVPMA